MTCAVDHRQERSGRRHRNSATSSTGAVWKNIEQLPRGINALTQRHLAERLLYDNNPTKSCRARFIICMLAPGLLAAIQWLWNVSRATTPPPMTALPHMICCAPNMIVDATTWLPDTPLQYDYWYHKHDCSHHFTPPWRGWCVIQFYKHNVISKI
jgi:hypothetical protein